MARVKAKPTETETAPAPAAPSVSPFEAFDTLMSTAAVDSQVRALADSQPDAQTLNTALSEALSSAHQRWGLGLHHLTHEARVSDDGTDILLLTDGREVARINEEYGAIAGAYEPMRSTDENGLSEWAALSDGYRAPADLPASSLKILIEHARDFETHWMSGKGGVHHRVWRKNDTLFVEVNRPVSAQTALSDAAWDVITSIKDRAFQRELMRRSEEVGMLGALLGARHAGAGAALARLPEAHFAVQAVVHTLKNAAGRNADEYRTALKNATAELEEAQGLITKQLGEVLRHGLNR
ncbi:DNA repair protein [Deinococcus cavernae]|uniref:DNA repair protein n=1 Tax=Deinococcus cavernae TaxID=2320857 RepID=A0A418UZZ9_9DEIO|nr:DNA repair protein [Deinococcus cavernae]RJF69045.1 DNA repair protein [Deinococcus cavernae]